MMGDFPKVRNWEDSGDVLQESTIRLMRALEEITPESPREFFGLAALQVRRQLLDLSRRYRRPMTRSIDAAASSDQSTTVGMDIAAPATTDSQRSQCLDPVPRVH